MTDSTPAPTPPPAPAPNSQNAIIALVLAIAAWVVCPLICSIIALVFAKKADAEIQASNGQLQGGTLVTVAKIVAWINIAFFALFAVIWLIVIIFAAVAGSAG
jgi:hypothetical protein